MLLAAFTRELLTALRSSRFLIALLLCVILMPLAAFVNVSRYEQRLSSFHLAESFLGKPETRSSLGYNSPVEAYRPPSPYSAFVMGIDGILPDKIVVTPEEVNLLTTGGSRAALAGNLDLDLIVGLLLSLLAFLFAAATVAEERESGELRFNLAGPLSRGKILMCKFLGNATALLLALVLGFAAAFAAARIASDHLPSDLLYYGIVLLALSKLYLISQLALGMLVSTLARRASSAAALLLVVWAFLEIIIPRTMPLLAELFVPAKPHHIVQLEKDAAASRAEFEMQVVTIHLYDSTMRSFGLDPLNVQLPTHPSATRREILAHKKYWEIAVPIVRRFATKLQEDFTRLESEEEISLKDRQVLASVLGRFSPVSTFSSAAAELSGTGVGESQNLGKNAAAFRKLVQEELYSRFERREYGASGTVIGLTDPHRPVPTAYPRYRYSATDLAGAIEKASPGIITLLGYALVSVIALWLRFRNYEVR